jgi:hypothetical protein
MLASLRCFSSAPDRLSYVGLLVVLVTTSAVKLKCGEETIAKGGVFIYPSQRIQLNIALDLAEHFSCE